MPFNPHHGRRPISSHSTDHKYTPIEPLAPRGGGSTSILLVRRKADSLLCVRKKLRGFGESGRAWREEMEVLRSLQHPHVVEYIDSFIDVSRGPGRESAALFTEWCDLGSLGDFKENMTDGRVRVPEAFAWHVLRSLVSAVCYCHRGPGGGTWLSVVHRDIKPDNIFLKSSEHGGGGRYPIVKLGDFGSAVGAENPEFYDRHALRGTQGWEPPEFPSFGQRGDVWGLGAVVQSLCRLRMDTIDPRLGVGREYSEDLDECVRACLTEDKVDRPFVREVALMVEELGVAARYNFKALPPRAFG